MAKGKSSVVGGTLVVLLLCLVVAGASCDATPRKLKQEEIIREKVRSIVEPAQKAEEAFAAGIHDLSEALNDRSGLTDLFSLIPGRYPHAVSLPDFLAQLPSLPGGPEAIQIMVELIQNKTGVKIPQTTVDMILKNSALLLNYFKLTTRAIHDLWVGLNYAMPAYNQTTVRIPSGFKYPEDIASFALDVDPYIPSLAPLSPNSSILFGFEFPSTTTKDQVKINLITSLIFNQLSDNHHLKPTDADWFVVSIKGKLYSRVDDVLHALLAQGAHLRTYLTKRIAAFYGLYMIDQHGNKLEVADPVMIQTGIFDSTGTKEVILPAIHSEFVIELQLQNFNFNVVWYEGDDGIGFFPGDMYVLESWVGELNGPNITGTDGVRAVLYMSALRDILIQVAVKNNLWDTGYGVSGVCDDSCGIIEMVTTKSSTEYPNLMDKSFVIPEILYRVQQKDSLSYLYYDLLKIVNNMPVDWRGPKDPTAPSRAAGTIVWPTGAEPFQCVVDARAILSGH